MTPQHPQPPRTRGAAIAAYCRQCIHDPAAAGTWRAQVAVCTCTDCPLWRFRPVAAAAPPWIKSRNPADLPEGWTGAGQAVAVRTITGYALEKA